MLRRSVFFFALFLFAACSTPSVKPPVQNKYVKEVPLKGGEGWDILTFDSNSKKLYISRFDHVDIVDTVNGSVSGTISGLSGVHAVALAPEVKRGFITNAGDNTVVVFNIESLKEEKRIKVGEKPDEIIFDGVTKQILAFNGKSEDVSIINPHTLRVLKTVKLGGAPEFAVTNKSGNVFVNLEDKNEVVQFSPKSGKILSRWSLDGGEKPTGIAYDATRHLIFSACDNNRMIVLDSVKGNTLQSVPIGNGPDGAAFDELYSLAFIPNGKNGTLTVVRVESRSSVKVMDTVPTGEGARTITIDPGSGTAFLISGTVHNDQEHPKPRRYEDGSVKVLLFNYGSWASK